jgi:hypothetical protein
MIKLKNSKSILLIIFVFLITNCSKNSAMKPEDFKNKEPRLIIENYLSGNVKSLGCASKIDLEKSQDNFLQI